MAKTLQSFGHSECSRVNTKIRILEHVLKLGEFYDDDQRFDYAACHRKCWGIQCFGGAYVYMLLHTYICHYVHTCICDPAGLGLR